MQRLYIGMYLYTAKLLKVVKRLNLIIENVA